MEDEAFAARAFVRRTSRMTAKEASIHVGIELRHRAKINLPEVLAPLDEVHLLLREESCGS